MDKLDFIGFGALNMDMFYQLRRHSNVNQIISNLAPGGERMIDESERKGVMKSAHEYAVLTSRSGGGQAANTAVALARMGFQCGFLGKVGNDEIGDHLLESLGEMDKSHIQRGGNSGVCLCILDEKGERANAVMPACNDTIILNNSDVEYIKNCKILHLTSFCSENVLKIQERLVEHDLNDVIITFDPGEIYSRLGLDRLGKILKHTHILFATSEELFYLTGKNHSAAEDIIQYGTKIVVCKRGSQGSEIFTPEGSIKIQVTKVENVVDKTGAGDVYAAGFIAGILMELPMELCGKLASEAAALSISGYGREKYPDKVFLSRFK
jgi:ribokinase